MSPKHISVIGSCRVYTPLNKVIESSSFKLCHGKTEWFTHSTRDIIQKIKIVTAEMILEPEMIPFVINDLKKFNPQIHKSGFYESADLHVIEVCSIQSNRFSNLELQQWCVRDLKETPGDNENIISELKSSLMTKTEILNDLEIIYSLLKCKPILFVSHNMLPKPDGTIPKPRPIIKDALETFSDRKSNVYFFDPTSHIIEYGIEKAMKDPAHYTKDFEPILGAAIIEKLLSISA